MEIRDSKLESAIPVPECQPQMPYRYLEDIAPADAAFEAWGQTLEEMIAAAAEATLHIMVGNPETIRSRDHRSFQVSDTEIDLLLLQVLQELIYFKDAEQLLLRVQAVRLERCTDTWTATIAADGESIAPRRHQLIVDVKAVTLHRLQVLQTGGGWRATVVVDV